MQFLNLLILTAVGAVSALPSVPVRATDVYYTPASSDETPEEIYKPEICLRVCFPVEPMCPGINFVSLTPPYVISRTES